MISYAGIGSRRITEKETSLIKKIAKKLSDLGFVVYSGNAEGADISFQLGSEKNCVLMLPWEKFNTKEYDISNCIESLVVGKSKEALDTVKNYHPAPENLSYGGKLMMARNWHQIVGYEKYPQVSFVICCSDENNGEVIGGTGQAVRIAKEKNIPVFNIRNNWDERKDEFKMLIKSLKEKIV